MNALTAQLRTELRLIFRNGEQLLVSLGIPLAILVFFSRVELTSGATAGDPIDRVAPGVLALAIMSSSLVGLGVGTGFDRSYSVLKRLGATPLGRSRLIMAKLLAVLCTELVQFAVLVPVSLALGFEPVWSGWPSVLAATVLGTAAFGGSALLMAGQLSGLANLAASNLIYLLLLGTSGVIVELSLLPGPVRWVAELLPAAPLVEIISSSLTGADISVRPWITLGAWAVTLPVAAIRWFRWEP